MHGRLCLQCTGACLGPDKKVSSRMYVCKGLCQMTMTCTASFPANDICRLSILRLYVGLLFIWSMLTGDV
eukprot:12942933-Heterocapsa_arctica.AAC.1